MPTRREVVNGRISGADAVLPLQDEDGNLYEIIASGDDGTLVLRKNQVVIGFAGLPKIEAKTADYTVLATDNGKIFNTLGAAGTVNFTLPALTAVPIGFRITILQCHDEELKITSAEADSLIVGNDLAADSIAFTTASEQIGNHFEVIKVSATRWFVRTGIGLEAFTATVVTD